MQQSAADRLAEVKVMLVAELEHMAHGLRPSFRIEGRSRAVWRDAGPLDEGQEVVLQLHTACLGLGGEAGFKLTVKVEGDAHDKLPAKLDSY